MKILSLEWRSKGRDIDITEPVLYYLEKFFNHQIIRESIYQFEFKILKYRPDVVIIANGIGAPNNFDVVKFSNAMGIKVITLISEGDFVDDKDGMEIFFWGWNREKKLYEDLHLEWSEKNVNYIQKYLPNVDLNKIKVSGATGFDKYKILKFKDKNYILNKYNLTNFSQVILLVAWGFDCLYSFYFEKYKDDVIKRYKNIQIIENIKTNRDPLNLIYKKLIENNPDKLFILKYHPGTVDKNETEFRNLENYPNVLPIITEENIFDLINASDLLIAFESTTALEAWLLNKKSIVVTPASEEFDRSLIHKGSPLVKTYENLQQLVDEFFTTGSMKDFDKLEKVRSNIIKHIIEFDDGKNHIRAAKYIQEIIEKNIEKNKDYSTIWKYLFKAFVRGVIVRLKLYKLPIFKKFYETKWLKEIFDFKERENIYLLYKECLDEFYQKYGSNI